MKLWVLSDLHNEFGDFEPSAGTAAAARAADVIVLAGDVHLGGDSAAWAKRFADAYGKPAILIAGNHEFYGGDFDHTLAELRTGTRDSNVHFLENDSWIHRDVRFLGCTLWTDFLLYGSAAMQASMRDAANSMNDYRQIQAQDHSRLLQPADTLRRHQASRAWLSAMLKQPYAGTTVVVTHHAPSPRSIDPAYAGDKLTPAYVSDLEKLMSPAVQLWIHGHKHVNFDYRVNGVRVVCNPRGYTPRYLNPGFAAACVVEV